MKKAILAVILAVTFGSLSAQVKSTTMISAKSIIGAAVITHYDSTTSKSDVYWTRIEVAQKSNFPSSFFSVWTKRIGSGTFVDIIGYPLVDTLTSSYVRVEVTDDTTKAGKISLDRIVTPKHKLVLPDLYSVKKVQGITSYTEQMSFNLGYADSCTIRRYYALNKEFVNKSAPKYWKFYKDGSVIDTITGLKDQRKFWIWWTITTYFGSKEIIDTFWTNGAPKKIWLRKPLIDTTITSSSITFKGSAISFGLTGTIWVTGFKAGNPTPPLVINGVGEETYSLTISGLSPKTTYTNIWIHGSNTLGQDSFMVGGITTDDYINPTLSIVTSNTYIHSGFVEAWATYNVPKGTIATISAGVFSDSLCTSALQDTTYKVSQGVGTLHKIWYLKPGTYYVWFWGNSTDGQYVNIPQPKKVVIKFGLGITDFKKSKISVCPNPAINFLNVPSNDLYVITDMTGRTLQTINGPVINIENLLPGNYMIRTGNSFARFEKQ
ncbi:hypothetical protein IT400_03405 [Candidatus Nomurabacteria bacterium]|nr:hypothetical protein [Candidatus Nomurabacteria bacterium]